MTKSYIHSNINIYKYFYIYIFTVHILIYIYLYIYLYIYIFFVYLDIYIYLFIYIIYHYVRVFDHSIGDEYIVDILNFFDMLTPHPSGEEQLGIFESGKDDAIFRREGHSK